MNFSLSDSCGPTLFHGRIPPAGGSSGMDHAKIAESQARLRELRESGCRFSVSANPTLNVVEIVASKAAASKAYDPVVVLQFAGLYEWLAELICAGLNDEL